MGKKKNKNLPNPQLSKVHVRQFELTTGPLPSPSVFQKYEEVLPGAAERILIMAEKQSEHRRDIEAKVISSDTFNSKLGLIFGFIIGMTALIGSYLLITHGMVIPGSILGGGTVVALVSTFVYGSRQRRQERVQRLSR
jgi:uncharacterized membrane protein